MKGSRGISSSKLRMSTANSKNNPQSVNTSNLKSPNSQAFNTQPVKIEDEYITNLQKQIYYLELEMKLMKDKEIETKNKVGGYEVLFRDGVPLNEHFLALKTKYTNEKDQFEKYITDLNTEIYNINNENKYLQSQIDETNKNYYEILERLSRGSDYYSNKLMEINSKLDNENNTKEILLKDKEITNKSLHQFNSENIHFVRTLEKNKLFKENVEEKNKNAKEKNNEKFDQIDKQVVKSLLEQEAIERKIESNAKGKFIENENAEMIMIMNKLEREYHLAKAKISELENNQILSKKYLMDEELIKKIHDKENKRLNEELDGLIKLNEENLKQKVKQHEKNQSIIIKNSISNNELKMGLLLTKYKDEEHIARELLEEKNNLTQKLMMINEVIDNQNQEEFNLKRELIDIQNAIDELENYIEDNKNNYNNLVTENEKLKQIADKNEVDIQNLNVKIEEFKQKIELNTILKDIDVSELKMLSQNNALVNNSINNLISKWDKVQTKLHEIEENQKSNLK